MNTIGILDKKDTTQDTIEIHVRPSKKYDGTFYEQQEESITLPTNHDLLKVYDLHFAIIFSFNKKKNIKSITLTMNHCTDNAEEKISNVKKVSRSEYEKRISDRECTMKERDTVVQKLCLGSSLHDKEKSELINEFDLYCSVINNHKIEEQKLLNVSVDVEYTKQIDTYTIILPKGTEKVVKDLPNQKFPFTIYWTIRNNEIIKTTKNVTQTKTIKKIDN
jgi:hypothetical protein